MKDVFILLLRKRAIYHITNIIAFIDVFIIIICESLYNVKKTCSKILYYVQEIEMILYINKTICKKNV